jgi:hypothetical protein
MNLVVAYRYKVRDRDYSSGRITLAIGGIFAAAGLLFLFGSVTGRVHTGN